MSFINWGSESPEQLRIRKALEEQMLLEQAMQSAAMAVTAATGSGGLKKAPTVFYLRAFDSDGGGENSDPWTSPNYVDELNAVFGESGWALKLFETVDLESILTDQTTYIYIDGSDNGAEELVSFLDINHVIIEAWVYAGGKLFLNAAPNEGGNINLGFGGVTLLNDSPSGDATIASGQSGHPIFNGPGECGDSWTGNDFAHATLDGEITPLIVNPGEYVICGEISWGSGKVVFGGMTSVEFHDPQPEATYLKQNIHSYLSGKNYTPQLGLRAMSSGTGEKRTSRR